MASSSSNENQEKKTVVILGATGAQGGCTLRALARSPEFNIVALTRNVESEKAKALSSLPNVTVKKADLDDKDSLQAAFEGAYGVFALTNFWEHMSPAKEYAQAKSMADAAKSAGVKHVVWSTLENTPEFGATDSIPSIDLDGKAYKVPHFDAKGLSDQHFKDAGVPTTFLLTSFYYENFIHFGLGPKKDGNGDFKLTLPLKEDTKLPVISTKDIGVCAAAIFKDPSMIGKTVGISGDMVTGPEMAQAIADARGVPVAYQAVSAETFRSFGFPGAHDLANMFQFKEECNEGFCGRRSLEFSKTLSPNLIDMKTWCSEHAKEIPMD